MKELECWSIIDRETIKDLEVRGWVVKKLSKKLAIGVGGALATVRATRDGKRWVAAPNVAALWDRIQEFEASVR